MSRSTSIPQDRKIYGDYTPVMHRIELNWIELNWIELNWIELNWNDFIQTGKGYTEVVL